MQFRHSFFCLLFCVLCASSFGQTVLTESFSSGTLPAGWTRETPAAIVGWEFGSSLSGAGFIIPAHGNYAAADHSTSGHIGVGDDKLITPFFSLSGYTSAAFQFEYIGAYSPPSTVMKVEISTDGGTAWTTLPALVNSNEWKSQLFDISAWAGEDSVKIAFVYNDNNWLATGFGIDDILVFIPPVKEGEAFELTLPDYLPLGASFFEFIFRNNGTTTVTSFDLLYAVDGASATTRFITGISIPFNDTLKLGSAVLTSATFGTAGWHTLTVWISNVNGSPDSYPENDTLRDTVSVVTSVPDKKVLLEIYTGAWCGWCPQGELDLEDAVTAVPSSIPVGVHFDDGMELPEGALAFSELGMGGCPSGLADRYQFTEASPPWFFGFEFTSAAMERANYTAPVAVSFEGVSYNAITREISGSLRTDFVGSTSETLRLNVWFTADSLIGSGFDWDQRNYNDGTVGHPHCGLGDPILNYAHRNVLVGCVGGAYGSTGFLPGSISFGASYTMPFIFTLPISMPGQTNIINPASVNIIGMVQRYVDSDPWKREILNVGQLALSEVTTHLQPLASESGFMVWPNPAHDCIWISSSGGTVMMQDLQGKDLFSSCLQSGVEKLELGDLSPGMYIIQVEKAGKEVRAKIVVE